jgi:hypothetical protein
MWMKKDIGIPQGNSTCVHHLCTTCAPPVHHMCTSCAPPVHNLCTTCVPSHKKKQGRPTPTDLPTTAPATTSHRPTTTTPPPPPNIMALDGTNCTHLYPPPIEPATTIDDVSNDNKVLELSPLLPQTSSAEVSVSHPASSMALPPLLLVYPASLIDDTRHVCIGTLIAPDILNRRSLLRIIHGDSNR